MVPHLNLKEKLFIQVYVFKRPRKLSKKIRSPKKWKIKEKNLPSMSSLVGIELQKSSYCKIHTQLPSIYGPWDAFLQNCLVWCGRTTPLYLTGNRCSPVAHANYCRQRLQLVIRSKGLILRGLKILKIMMNLKTTSLERYLRWLALQEITKTWALSPHRNLFSMSKVSRVKILWISKRSTRVQTLLV